MTDSKRTTTSGRPKYMSEKECEGCGAKFMGGANAWLCPECRPMYHARYLAIYYKRRRMAGAASAASIRAEAIAWVRAMRKVEAAPAPAPSRRCGYCGRELGPRAARRGYCAACVAHGYHWLHEVTGRTRRGAPDKMP